MLASLLLVAYLHTIKAVDQGDKEAELLSQMFTSNEASLAKQLSGTRYRLRKQISARLKNTVYASIRLERLKVCSN
jgi:hypothetical protein